MREQLWASHTAAALGLDPYKQPYEIWSFMRDGVWPYELPTEESQHQQIGRVLEPVIARMGGDVLGVTLTHDEERLESEALPWLSGRVEYRTPDGYPLDAKVVGINVMREWTKEEPSIVADIAMRVYLALSDQPVGYISAWLGGSMHRFYTIYRDMEKEAQIAANSELFVRCVQDGTPPDIVFDHNSTERLMKALCSTVDSGKVIDFDEKVMSMLETKAVLSQRKLDADKGVRAIDNELKMMMGDAWKANLPDGTWLERHKIDCEAREQAAYSYIRLYHKKPR